MIEKLGGSSDKRKEGDDFDPARRRFLRGAGAASLATGLGLSSSPANAQGPTPAEIGDFKRGLRDVFDPINFPPLANDMVAQPADWSGIDLDQNGAVQIGIDTMPSVLKPHLERFRKALVDLITAKEKIRLFSMQDLLMYRKEPERIKLYFRGGYENSPVTELVRLKTELEASVNELMRQFSEQSDFRSPMKDFGKHGQLLLRIRQACQWILIPGQKKMEEAVDTIARDYDRMNDRSNWDTAKPTKEEYEKVRFALLYLNGPMLSTAKLPEVIRDAIKGGGVFKPGI